MRCHAGCLEKCRWRRKFLQHLLIPQSSPRPVLCNQGNVAAVMKMASVNPQPHRRRRLLLLSVKILIAGVGLWYVISQISWHNHVFLKLGSVIRGVVVLRVAPVRLLRLGRSVVKVSVRGQPLTVRLASGVVVAGTANRVPINWPAAIAIPRKFLVALNGQVEIRRSLPDLMLSARLWPLLAALLLLGLPTLITTWRWWRLLAVQDLQISYAQCLRLTFVGQFYSAFLPGSVSGDVVKGVYTGRATGAVTASAVSIVLDRLIGLLALMVLALLAIAVLLLMDFGAKESGTARAGPLLMHLFWVIAGLLIVTGAGLLIYFLQPLRRWLGLQALLDRLPLPKFVRHADRTLRGYRGHPGLMVVLFAVSLCSQCVAPVAGWLIGQAFAMQSPFAWYWGCLPVAALAVSAPIMPPMGLGVLDWLLLFFFVTHGVDSANQAFALAQTLRFLPLCWSMVGAYWVLRGKFSHAGGPMVPKLDRGA